MVSDGYHSFLYSKKYSEGTIQLLYCFDKIKMIFRKIVLCNIKSNGRITGLIFLIVVVFCCAVGCGAAETPKEVSPFVGTWKSVDLLEEILKFKKDGTGHNKNPFWPYDFKYETEGDQLNIYTEVFGMDSDEPMSYTDTIQGDSLTMVDNMLILLITISVDNL